MIKEVKKLEVRDGETLNLSIIENGSPVWIIVTHGLGEHGARHDYFYNLFSQNFNVCIYDIRGHGDSSGKRAHTESFKDFSQDLGEIISYLKDSFSLKRYVLFGHSMGALVVSSFMQNEVNSEFYPEKVFLSGPPVAGAGKLGKILKLAPMKVMNQLCKLPMTVPISGLIDIKKLSHDPRVYTNYVGNKLNSMAIHSKLFFEILGEGRKVFSRPLRVKCPLYVAVAGDDALIDSKSAIHYFSKVEKNAVLTVFDGAYHELHNEIEKYRLPYFEFLKTSIVESTYS